MTISQTAVNDYLRQYGYSQPTVTAPVQQNVSVFEAQPQPQAVAEDGADDGKISFGKKAKNFGKGCLKFITGMFTGKDGKFSLKQTLKSVAIVAAGVALSWCTGGTSLAAAAVALGVVTGGVKVVKGAIKASKATTDADAEAAWQDIGLGVTTVGVSIAGAKSAMKSSTGAKFEGNALQATKECFLQTGKNVKSAGSSIVSSVKAGTFKADAAALVQTGKNNFIANANSVLGSNKAMSNFQNSEIAKIDKQIAKLDATKDADMISQLTARKQTLSNEIGHIQNATSTDDIASIIKTSEDKLQALQASGASKSEIVAMQKQVNILKTAGQIKTGQIKNLIAQTNQQADKISKLTEQIAKLDNVKDAEKIVKLTAERNNLINSFNANKQALSTFDATQLEKITLAEAKAVVKNGYATPLTKPVINNVKNNPFIGRNVEEAQGYSQEEIAYMQQTQQSIPQQFAYMPTFTSTDYTAPYFNQFSYNNPFQF